MQITELLIKALSVRIIVKVYLNDHEKRICVYALERFNVCIFKHFLYKSLN